jgi:glyoxylase-like metal-dependent hydrolase (beta-lactamase superfamily II)
MPAERVYEDETVAIDVLRNLGPLANNAYIVRPAGGGPVMVVDAPEGSEATVEALGEAPLAGVVLTHSHRDHWGGHEVLRARSAVPFFAGAAEVNLDAVTASGALERLADGATFAVGEATVEVVHTPGHTPGSICLLVGRALLTGDALFPGGPGYSRDHVALLQEIESITTRLYPLGDELLVLPGHGDSTTIGASKAEYAVFASKEHAEDLHGDVLWTES